MSVISRSLSVSPCLRGDKKSRRGQTLILALAILFLLTILGSIFVTTLLRNLARVTRQGKTDESLTLAMAGIQFAANQFRTSEEGADWRPSPSEPLWRTPNVAAPPPQRQLDPDVDWLSDNGTYQRPYVRFATGRGRFLLRVTFLPSWEAQSAASAIDQFQSNSEMIHIESIGRSGEFDPNDPSFLRDPTATRGTGDSTSFRKVEAFVPIGLIDQLWWITNHTNEPGPAKLGVSMIQNNGYDPRYASNPAVTPQFNQQFMEYPAMYQGSIRSNTDLEFYGRNVIRFYPARGEGVFVKGEIRLAPRGALPNPGSIQLQIDAMDDDGNNRAPTLVGPTPVLDGDANLEDDPANDSRLASIAESESTAPTFDPLTLLTQARSFLWGVLDGQHRRQDPTTGPGSPMMRSIRNISAPLLNQEDFAKGINRWRTLTRDSGPTIQLASGRYINTGAYGLTDRVTAIRTDDPSATPVPALTAAQRAKGLYIDNFDDVQFPKNRPRVKDEWLQRLASPSWQGDTYTPTIDKTVDHPDRKTPSPVVDLLLTSAPDASGVLRPVIKETRFDPDVRQVNEPQGNSSDPRLAYNLINNAGTWDLTPVGQTRTYDYPENGVVFAEGSIRVRGVSGIPYDPANPNSNPQPLTIVSGGTIYLEGNLLQLRGSTPETSASGWQISLLAQDNVVLNPSAFTRVTNANGSVLPPAGDPDDPTVDGFYRIQPGSEIDFASTTADTLTASRWLLHVKHAGGDRTDPTAETRVTLNLPNLPGFAWPAGGDQYDFGTNVPPPATPTYSGTAQPYYLFHEISPGTSPISWGETSWRYPDREQKTFFIPGLGGRMQVGVDNTFRIQTNLSTVANDKDYLLGKVALLPETGPLPIRIEAVMYAFTGSWFVIPPPFFNDHLDAAKQGDPYDTRAFFAANSLVREDPATYPINTDHYPFYREPLNVDIQVVGAITENMPAEPAERALWTSHVWLSDPNYDPSAFPAASPPPFRPNLRYQYDGDLRRMVRVRNTRTGQEVVAWAAPTTTRKPLNMPTVLAQVNQWLAAEDAYAVTLPLTPRLPSGAVFYEGNPL